MNSITKELFIAHINNEEQQSCQTHSQNTAIYAESNLMSIGLGEIAYLAGLLHDCGKFTNEFTEYIEAASEGKTVKKGSIIHTFAGVYYLLTKYHNRKDRPFDLLASELIAYAIGSHHGLFDCINDDRKNGFLHRLNKQPSYEQRAISNFNAICSRTNDVDDLFQKASQEIEELYPEILKLETGDVDEQEILFYIGLIARMLCSAVIDGDRRDTAEFMAGTDFNSVVHATPELWDKCLTNLERLLHRIPCETEIQKARKEISDLSVAFADEPSGIYRLNVPTGGGKTLSSLRYALKHASIYNKKRIIYTAPLISILDQNAEVIHEAIDNDEIILEHHSNILKTDMSEDELDKYELLKQTWDAPVIITTLVQLLNSMFSGKTSDIRRFHSLCDSVIIIDEVQTVPVNMLSLFNLTVNFLSRLCGTTIILCSATQPCFESAGNHKMLISEKRILPENKYEYYSGILKRTDLIDKGSFSLSGITELTRSVFEDTQSLLVICNTKREAATLFKYLSQYNYNCYHLSASMCMAHRKKVLERVNRDLSAGRKVILVSTQVIEAGVDISFGTVIRFTAGMDNIVQAAGRCNRNGENDGVAPVYIVRCEGENLGSLKDIIRAQDASNNLLGAFFADPKRFSNNLASDESIDFYYKSLYNASSSDLFDYPFGRNTLLSLISDNQLYAANGECAEEYIMHQAFKTAGSIFEVFESDSESVIVPYEKGQELIAAFQTKRAKNDLTYMKLLLEQSKEYTVSVYKNQIDTLMSAGGVVEIADGNLLVLCEDWYDNKTGLSMKPVEKEDNECNILIL